MLGWHNVPTGFVPCPIHKLKNTEYKNGIKVKIKSED